MQTGHFLLLFHIKSIQEAKHKVAFIVKQPQEMQCIWHQG